MNALVRWNPFQEMEAMHRRMASLLNGSTLDRGQNQTEENLTLREWTPLVDIVEDDQEYLIKMELPGVKREEVKVTVDNGALTISGERQVDRDEKHQKYHRIERYYGRFERSFIIPNGSEASDVRAEFKDGVLWVHLAKGEKARPRQIEIKVA
jgi:HSP20 family protein